jgi:NAD(P)H dehydrogenase (quinone)
VLTEPGHERATYELAGPELTTVRGLAAAASEVLGRSVVAVAVDRRQWAAGPGAALPARARADLLAMFAAYDAQGLTGNPRVLTALLGRPPSTWRGVLVQAR